jgi:hypothetical protein
MKDQIISYRDMCDNEKIQTLQRGMNYRLNPQYSVILMSQRTNAPYKDEISRDGLQLTYEGHDVPKSSDIDSPKLLDQPGKTKTGKLTQNGKFALAAKEFKKGLRDAEIVRVYEKMFAGVWTDKGFFKLIDYKYVSDSTKRRKVFRFILEEMEVDIENGKLHENKLKPRTRIIPSSVKQEVWARDGGKCVECGATDELHFDHDIPFSKGGSSITADNVKLLCARHNLQKSAKIQ